MSDNKFSKTDMERVGIFQEMSYITIADRYKDGGHVQFNEAAAKGKQILPGGSKTRSSLQAGYFNDKFARVLEGEAYTDPIKMRRQYRLKEAKKNIGKPFLPSNGEKKLSGLGSHYGTLSGPIQALSPQGRPKKPYKQPSKNILTNPGKRGTGYGYVSVTIGEYQKHLTDEYDRAKENVKKDNAQHRGAVKGGAFKLNMHPTDYFDENPYRGDRPLPPAKKQSDHKIDVKPFKPSSPGKNPAGMKAGTFDPYPSHSADPYKSKLNKHSNIVNKSGKIFMPSAGPKSAPITSVMETNVMKKINSSNYKLVNRVMAY
ncbi:hypothetical protein LSH36_321g05015 [Paralvinella palmiformis]|uniref:Cilia-and flagella-associated protein 96 n=1 Tax=Paralvinella palmiformis TaxID=53620 RepID=A0AAD9JGG9_9ANNE|nr:hypothetical protein LSH36_321g05015 [Paralvinella palmiformis]